jgi:hypothetical protein
MWENGLMHGQGSVFMNGIERMGLFENGNLVKWLDRESQM